MLRCFKKFIEKNEELFRLGEVTENHESTLEISEYWFSNLTRENNKFPTTAREYIDFFEDKEREQYSKSNHVTQSPIHALYRRAHPLRANTN